MRKFFNKYKLYFLLMAILIFIANIILFILYINAPKVFTSSTFINGIDCSNLNVKQSEEKLINEWSKKNFIVQDGDHKGNLSLQGCTYDIEKELENLADPDFFTYVLMKLHIKDKNLSIPMNIKQTGDNFDKDFDELFVFDNEKNKIQTKDAYIDLNSRNFDIVKEQYGNNIDKDLLKQDIIKLISNGEFVLNYNESNYIKKPKVYSDSSILIKEQEYLKSLDFPKIIYVMPKGELKVKQSHILQMYGINNKTIKASMNSNKLIVDKKYVKKFVDTLANKYNTSGRNRKFKSSKKGRIFITGGDYGYVINREKEFKRLIKDLNLNKDVKRTPKYARTPYDKSDEVGKSYVELDLSLQHLWVYKNGKLIVSTDVVTGDLANGYATPSGIYYLKYKQRDTTLSGDNADGSRYNSKVSYWMPFNGGIGLHDATWRSSFGGNIYKSNGSHGCVNMPPAKAKKTFDTIESGYPIVVHY